MKFKKKRVRQGKQKREVGYEKDLHYSKLQQIIVGLENFRHIQTEHFTSGHVTLRKKVFALKTLCVLLCLAKDKIAFIMK